MVLFLTGIGFATSAWWLVTRDVYSTAVFHNFFGLTGVLAALRSRDALADVPSAAGAAIALALIATALLALLGAAWARPGRRAGVET